MGVYLCVDSKLPTVIGIADNIEIDLILARERDHLIQNENSETSKPMTDYESSG